MALKSKAKPKGKGKHVARAPRATPVEVRPPILLRKRVQIVLAFLAGIGLAAVVVWATNGLRAERAGEREREVASRARQAVAQYQAVVDRALQPVGQQVGPGVFTPFPELGPVVRDLEKGRGNPDKAADVGRSVVRRAAAAADAIEGVDLVELVRDKGFDVTLVQLLIDSKTRMRDALRLYERSGRLLRRFDGVGARDRGVLVATVGDLHGLAESTFADGYGDYAQTLGITGLFPTEQIPQVPPIGQ